MATYGFVDVLVEETELCKGCVMRWKAESAPRVVEAVLYEPETGGEGRYLVRGWSSVDGGSPCPATAVTVEDSGGGTAVLVWGGDLGLRLEPQDGGATLAEPYLLLDPAALLT
jgi:hypothetical protein